MGFCRDGFGPFGTEERRESFIIHPDDSKEGYEKWAERPHPEFLLEDLPDLLRALEELLPAALSVLKAKAREEHDQWVKDHEGEEYGSMRAFCKCGASSIPITKDPCPAHKALLRAMKEIG